MNAVEIEEAVSALAEAPFDAETFPFAFLAAFGNKETAIKRLRAGATNQSDLSSGVLQRSNIHILVAPQGQVGEALDALRDSPRTKSAKARYILATDGVTLEAEDLSSGETVACDYAGLPNHFGFFLPLAGITTVRQIRESAFDIRATSRLNKLYVELLKDNPDWGTPERRSAMNHFMARLIFCFFAEDTGIFPGQRRFTLTIDQMSARDSSNTHEVIETLFRAMNTKDHAAAGIPRWADFPYVNGGLFSGGTEVPRFSKLARSYLLHIGNLDWTQINPDIFGSMIQAVADDEERGALGMHYTSVPNILKVLNPLFLDDLRAQLEAAGDNPRMLLNLRKRMSRIRVFDPACGSGNFLVIAYKEMRAIEAEINGRRGEPDRRSDIPLTNFRGIELREFPAEIARLALIIAEYQADELHRGQKEAVRDFLPLNRDNWITCGNALRLDWLSICPPTGTGVKLNADDLFQIPLAQAEIDFQNEGGETYVCGNPPYLGSVLLSSDQKDDLKSLFEGRTNAWKSLDYVAGWFLKAADYSCQGSCAIAFVATNSICQGEQVPILWPIVFATGHHIAFARTSFKWSNLASNKAGVTVVIVGLSTNPPDERIVYTEDHGSTAARSARYINAYLVSAPHAIVKPASIAIGPLSKMVRGNMPNDGGHLLMDRETARTLVALEPSSRRYVRRFIGAREFVRSEYKHCLWIDDAEVDDAMSIPAIRERVEAVKAVRQEGGTQARAFQHQPHKFVFSPHEDGLAIVVPAITSENRDYLPVGLVNGETITGAKCYVLYNAPLWNLALIASRMHWVWIGAVCVRMRTDFSYSNTLGWNTFPLPALTETNKAALARCAADILLAREALYPASIADLYDPEKMPADLRAAHERNDETLERIYIGRRFRNDTERLEKLFELYTKMTTTVPKAARSQAMN
ncbi:MAG: lactate dehydrogenase [Brevundimonas sp.]|jgi:hypothetical protein|uniref:class I SAM-dependent DNA methyltransferase n=1 Tax=Brevundimonas sp. TaxID=1871086 RepID=UPI0025BFCB47|nr:DNA methyltransferase [Brevundimonas sp.]MCH4268275.1 lactate dehydrogenase [Brevundimonas sp.]